jgi:putative ABC transport system permease protein
MNTQWRKVLGDFREHRLQIFLIGLVLTLGSAGVVVAVNARAILQREIAKSYGSAHSADVVLWFDKVEPSLLEKVRALPRVAAVDARRVAFTRVGGKGGAWFPMQLIIVRDFSDQQVGLIHQHQGGTWPSNDGGILIEQSGRSLLAAAVGEELSIRTPEGGTTTIPFAGYVHDTAVAPSTQDRMIYAYVTRAAAGRLGQSTDLDQLLVRMNDRGDMSDVAQFADDLNDWLKTSNQPPLRVDTLSNTHPHADLMSTMLRILQAFAAIAFTCSAALAIYMLSLWMKREVRQVGIMKTIGARSHQLAWQYIALIAPLLVVTNGLALPIGAWIGRWLVGYYQTSLNIDVAQWDVPRSLLLNEIIFTLGIPFFAMAVPIVRAARMTAREAIHDPGITTPAGRGISTSRWIKVPGDRRTTFALRNTFRRPWRLAITLIALSLGGALLLTASNTYESLMRVVDRSLSNQGHDIHVQLQRPAPAARLESVARTVPEVQIAEAWRWTGVTVGKSAGLASVSESQRFLLCGYPPSSRLFKFPIEEGRLPQMGEEGAVVINQRVQAAIPGLQLGSELELHFRDRSARVRVIGIVEEIGTLAIYVTFPTFEAVTGLGDASTVLRVKTQNDHPDSVANALDQALLDVHLAPSLVQTSGEFRKSLEEHFAVVTDVMKMIALAAALVGAISLGASVSLNVLERAREIGVIRALGATPRTVSAIFLAEGGAVAVLSAVLSFIASILLSQALNNKASRELLHVPVPLHVSGAGLIILSSGILVVMLGVWLSLWRILRISVRDALAYE